MSRAARRKLLLCAALALSLGGILGRAATSQGPDDTAEFRGEVRELKSDGKPRRALVGDSGKTYPLIEDAGSAMFFKDPRLLNRPMRLTGRALQDGSLQVINVHSYLKGQLHEVYYWCDVCSIRRFELQKCDCCGDVMELRETPVK